MWLVKLPTFAADTNEVIWKVVDEFFTQEEAIDFVRDEFGGEEDGTIQLIYEED